MMQYLLLLGHRPAFPGEVSPKSMDRLVLARLRFRSYHFSVSLAEVRREADLFIDRLNIAAKVLTAGNDEKVIWIGLLHPFLSSLNKF